MDSAYRRLSIPEKIERTLQAPSTRALLEGRTGAPTRRVVPEAGATYGRQVTDLPFDIRAVYSPHPTRYAPGFTVTLRLPGPPGQPPPGRPGQPQLHVAESDGPEPPRLESNRGYVVVAHDVGIWARGTTGTVVVLTSPTDAFLVHGQGPWGDFAEPLDTFRQRLAR